MKSGDGFILFLARQLRLCRQLSSNPEVDHYARKWARSVAHFVLEGEIPPEHENDDALPDLGELCVTGALGLDPADSRGHETPLPILAEANLDLKPVVVHVEDPMTEDPKDVPKSRSAKREKTSKSVKSAE